MQTLRDDRRDDAAHDDERRIEDVQPFGLAGTAHPATLTSAARSFLGAEGKISLRATVYRRATTTGPYFREVRRRGRSRPRGRNRADRTRDIPPRVRPLQRRRRQPEYRRHAHAH